MDAQEIMARSRGMWQEKDLGKPLLTEVYDYCCPGISPYTGDQKQPRTQRRMYDSTAVYAVVALANRYYNEITPPSGDMASLEIGPLLAKQIGQGAAEEANKDLEEINGVLSLCFQTKSFSAAMWPAWMDYAMAGLGCVLMNEDVASDTDPFVFEHVSQADIAIETGAGGEAQAISRKRRVKIRQIQEWWPDAALPSFARAEKDGEKEIELIEFCHSVRKGNAHVWSYDLVAPFEKDGEILARRSYATCPFICWRGMPIPGSSYGLSRAMAALPDIRTVNVTQEMILSNAALAVAGMYLAADDGVLNIDNIQITNGGIIPVARTGGSLGASLVPLESGRAFDVGQIVLEDQRGKIKKGLMDSPLPDLDGKVRSATEFIERQKEMSRDFGAEIPRLLSDLVIPLYRRAVDIGARRGFVPPMKIDQLSLKLTVKTPLARNQDVAEVEKIVQWWQVVTMLTGPELAMAAVKMPEIVPYLSQKIGIPSRLYNSVAENTAAEEKMAGLLAQQASSALQTQSA